MRSNEVLLNCGITMPVMGLGTYSSENDRETTELAIHMALKMGYRHFDTAKIYGSEPAVGNALTEAILHGRVEREDIFVTSKLWGSDHHDPVSALKQTLLNMGMEYVDMYLVHWPVKLKPWACYAVPKEEDFEELEMESTWAGMEKCLDMGLCRCIGVSNFSSKKIEHLLNFASVPPAVNQIKYTFFQILARILFSSPIFNQNRMKENMGSFDLKLDDQDFNDIDRLEEWKIMRGEFLVNETTSPYRTIQELWDDEI
ncbi:hypothetical protein F2P56_001013 [Juglans regia]|uniref:NADP-dependent oxidoreductase domain-containing protein n=1 Tax=Juglans regia TaxID=51240 RepID=A0A834D856_JUGRE|nr:hypothetical protein F2P56_001013 [Juglans regia]